MITEQTRTRIKGFLEGFIQGLVLEHKQRPLEPPAEIAQRRAREGKIKPFHEALLPHELLRITAFERSLSSRLGVTFEECARFIGRESYERAERGYKVEGQVSAEAIRTIERIVNAISSGELRPNYPDLVEEVVQASLSNDWRRRKRIADLYLLDSEGNELFFEIKTPQPNKGQCIEAADRLLQIHAIKKAGPPELRTYYAMAYNPYGEPKSSYRHSFTLQYMDVDNQVLIGKEFWDLVGGAGTYEDVLAIYEEVGREKGPDMLDQLAFNY